MALWDKYEQDISQLQQVLEEKIYRLSVFQEFCRTVVSASAQEIKDLLLSSIAIITHSTDLGLALVQNGKLVLDSVIGSVDQARYVKSYRETPIWQSFLSGRAYYGAFIGEMMVSAVYPLTTKDGILGVLSLHTMQTPLNSEDRDYTEALVSLAAVALQHAIRYEQVQNKMEVYQDKAIHDSMTGFYNRHYLQEYGNKEMARAIRQKKPLSVVMFDVDHFKQFNDNFGHPFGDLVLKDVAKLTFGELREEDAAFRYGGEEFVILLSDCVSAGSAKMANRLRLSIEQHLFKDDQGIEANVTVSLGVAQWIEGETLEILIARADQALYRAKNDGRNRVRQWDRAIDKKQIEGGLCI